MSQYLTIDADRSTLVAKQMRGLQSSDWAKVPVVQVGEAAPVNMASEDDRLWFEDFANRCIRLRYPVEGDQHLFGEEPPKGQALVLVFCPTDGVRVRLPVRSDPENLPPADLLSGHTDADAMLTYMLVPTLEETRTAWGGAMVDRMMAALGQCLAAKGRLPEWSWLP